MSLEDMSLEQRDELAALMKELEANQVKPILSNWK